MDARGGHDGCHSRPSDLKARVHSAMNIDTDRSAVAEPRASTTTTPPISRSRPDTGLRTKRRISRPTWIPLLSTVMLMAGCAAPMHRATTIPPAANEPTPPPAASGLGRAKVGVAFGGGSARGIAHVGVIRWLEEHRVPIDVVAGTSMGGLVGGAFATGMDAAELERFITSIDWDH